MTLTSDDLFTFSTLLKTLRKRRRLTQQQLAEAVGVHRITLVRWEQGDSLPESKAIVLELARLLSLDDQETRQLLEASLTALAPHWSVLLPRNPYFTGREEVLVALHTQLGVDQAVALTQSSALHGLGGVGKTQIALEYAYRHALEYSAVFWIGAETEEQIISSFLRVASALQLPERDEKDQQRVIAAVQRWLSTHGQWLLVWDNVEDLDVLDRFLPAARSGAMLITTRRQALGTLARGLDLLPMEQEEGTLFLLRRAKVLSSEATGEQIQQFAVRVPEAYAAASEVVTALGGLPLALDQAGAYIEETQCSLQAYLELFHARKDALLTLRGDRSRHHPESVSTTLRLSIAATAQRHPAVLELLQVCSLLQPDAIPEELFLQGAEHLGAQLEAVCHDKLEWNRVVSIACSYSLLHRQPGEQTLSMHRLVQAVHLDSLAGTEQAQWLWRAIAALDAVFPDMPEEAGYANRQLPERLLPHSLLCLHRATAGEESLALASLAYKTAQYLRHCGRYAEAEPLYLCSLHIREQVLGPAHPDAVFPLSSLAELYRLQGKYAEAESLCLRALHIREQVLGPAHPDTASDLHSLAFLYWRQGRYEQAEPLFQRCLRIWEHTLGPEHSKTAHALNGLAILYATQGRYREAEPLFQRALHIQEQVQGPEHHEVARLLNNLAELSLIQDKHAEAEPLYLRALHIWEQVLGPEHPNVANALNGLANLYGKQRKYEQAEGLYQRILHIWEQTLGSEHPRMAEPLNGLANLFRDQEKHREAEALYQRALSIREQQLGQHHPDAAQTLYDLAICYQKQGRLSEASALTEHALQIRSQSMGDAHPQTLATQMLHAQLVQEQTDVQEKEASERRPEMLPDLHRNGCPVLGASSPPHQAVPLASSENNPLQEFLDACCTLHPRVWCRISDLWQSYEQWVEEQQERFPLSRRTFAAQLKARGCCVDRTSTARIWRGIAPTNKIMTKPDKMVTKCE